jgi:2-polyprenyl-3-methyl-5-hydroxy-6-metoxy-1,4-benzoquinol methylase
LTEQAEKNKECWVCGSGDLSRIKESNFGDALSSRNFAITNFEYGTTGELSRCASCGFIQCTDLEDVIGYYEDLEDTEYEDGRKERLLQERKVIAGILKMDPGKKLLDVGAGSGMLVEEAIRAGFQAEGIEPSKYLQKIAEGHGLPVHLGTFPHENTPGPYDVITFIDVLEHVTNPLELLTELRNALKDTGILVLVTPDVRSFMPRLLGYRWWHYRVAHIGYFNKKTLAMLADRAGLELIRLKRPRWYFSAHYLAVRALSFLPKFLRFKVPLFMENIIIPLNLRDSILAFYKPKQNV